MRHEIHVFTNVFIEARHESLTWVRRIQSAHSHPLFKIFILPFCRRRLGLPSGFFSSGISTKYWVCILFSPYIAHAQPLILLDLVILKILLRGTNRKDSHYTILSAFSPLVPNMCFSILFYRTLSLYSFLKSETKQSYNSVCLNSYDAR